jgi:hypothetical protein
MGAAKEYNKGEVVNFADSVDRLIAAVTQDGPGMDDLDEVMAVVTSSAQAVNEMRGVPAAAGLHIAGRVADKQGDRILAKAVAEEEAASVEE